MLLQAVDPSCVLVEAQAGSISQFPQVALKELQERVVQRAQTSVGAYVEYGEVIDAAIKVQAAYHELTGSESKLTVRLRSPKRGYIDCYWVL